MDKSYWKYAKHPNDEINWRILSGGTIWEVRPAAFDDDDPLTTLTNPATGTYRNWNTIETKCLYTDFNLQFYFRCPNMRDVWKNCSSALLGPENWGNSGVKIFSRDAYEVQILDSHGATDMGGGITDLNNCHLGGSKPVNTFEICGALYKYRAPDANPALPASNSTAPGDEYVPNGIWNHMEIEFMAARYKWEEVTENGISEWKWVKKKCATITVKFTGNGPIETIQDSIGLNPRPAVYDETADLVCDTVYDTEEDQKGWCKARGPIFLQEHDTKVQFKGITINPSWLPKEAGVFNDDWQQTSGCLNRS